MRAASPPRAAPRRSPSEPVIEQRRPLLGACRARLTPVPSASPSPLISCGVQSASDLLFLFLRRPACCVCDCSRLFGPPLPRPASPLQNLGPLAWVCATGCGVYNTPPLTPSARHNRWRPGAWRLWSPPWPQPPPSPCQHACLQKAQSMRPKNSVYQNGRGNNPLFLPCGGGERGLARPAAVARERARAQGRGGVCVRQPPAPQCGTSCGADAVGHGRLQAQAFLIACWGDPGVAWAGPHVTCRRLLCAFPRHPLCVPWAPALLHQLAAEACCCNQFPGGSGLQCPLYRVICPFVPPSPARSPLICLAAGTHPHYHLPTPCQHAQPLRG